jgi:tetratricopeptide (TPR) repeat protein
MVGIMPKNEINTTFIIRFIFCFLICTGALLAIWFFTHSEIFTFKHVFILSLCAIPFSFLCVYIIERLGSGIGGIFMGWTTQKISSREQLSADMARARYNKGKGQFEEALRIINQVLEKDPDYPDALYLKAHILFEGFENSKDALVCLAGVVKLVNDDEPIHRWALTYYDEVRKGHRIE